MLKDFMKLEPDSWEQLSTETIAKCRVFDVEKSRWRRSSDAKEADFYTVDHSDWANVIALTNEDEIVLVEQFRFGVKETVLELPSGMIDADETPEDAARRELEEETGYVSDGWILLGRTHPNPAIQGNWIYHYLAKSCEATGKVNFDPNESIATRIMPLAELRRLMQNGEFSHSLSVAAFALLDGRSRIS
ncbi:MAG: NUDIX hydrolase [Acidobacteriota bacterium]